MVDKHTDAISWIEVWNRPTFRWAAQIAVIFMVATTIYAIYASGGAIGT